MSYDKAQRVDLVKGTKRGIFSGGYVDNCESIDLAPYYSPYLRNCRLQGQSIIIRPGHTLHATLTAGSAPKGIGSYLRATPANDVLVVRHNQDTTKKLVTITDAGVITAITTGTDITSNNLMEFLNVGDVMYCMNGVDGMGKLSNITYTVPNVGIVNFAPSFSVSFNSSHRASGWSTNPNKVYKSVGDNYEDFNSTGSDVFTFSEPVTGLASTNQALFYFTKNTVAVTATSDIQQTDGTFYYSNRQLSTIEGAYNHACIVPVGNNVYYLNSAIQINKIATGQNINGFEILPLSQRQYSGITKIMDSLDRDQSGSYGEYLSGPSLIKRHLKSQGSLVPDITIVYDTLKDAFLIDDAQYYSKSIDFHQKHYACSAIEPKIFIDEEGQDDDDSPIGFEYRTKEFYITEATLKKLIRESRALVDINELAALYQYIYLNGLEKDSKMVDKDNILVLSGGGLGTDVVGEESIGEDGDTSSSDDLYEIAILRTKGNLNKKFNKIQRVFTNDTLAGKVRLKSLSPKIEVLPPETTNLTK